MLIFECQKMTWLLGLITSCCLANEPTLAREGERKLRLDSLECWKLNLLVPSGSDMISVLEIHQILVHVLLHKWSAFL